jgi:hypothetical protein
VNQAATTGVLAMVADVFGTDPVAADRSFRRARRCQAEVMRRAGAVFDAVWSEVNAVKRRESRTIPSRDESKWLAGEFDAAIASGAQLAKARAKTWVRLNQRCGGPIVPGHFACGAADTTELTDCVIDAAITRAREAIEAADAIDFDKICPAGPGGG